MKKMLLAILCLILLFPTSCGQVRSSSDPASPDPASPSSEPLDESFPDYEGSVTIWCYFDEIFEMGERKRVLQKRVIDGYQAGVLVQALRGLEALEDLPVVADALCDGSFEEFTAETLPALPGTYFISLDNENRLYRFYDVPVLVDEFLGEGAAWPDSSYTKELHTLISNTFTYWPYNYYYGTAQEELTMTHALKMPAPLAITVIDLKRSVKISDRYCPIDELTLNVYAKEDLQHVSISLYCYQGDDLILGDADCTLSLKKGESTTVKLEFTSDDFYRLIISSTDTKIIIDVQEEYFQN